VACSAAKADVGPVDADVEREAVGDRGVSTASVAAVISGPMPSPGRQSSESVIGAS
jgi:hypothetical protein